jgi:cytochrome c oxidase assembly protein subunit 15
MTTARPQAVPPLDLGLKYDRAVGWWLLGCATMVFVMILIGGVTRLTESGLSIVEWQPLIGAVPPLSQADWQALFEKYQQSPEYQQVNFGMSLEDFKGIFWLEYIHRLWGRLLGFAFALPALFFLVKGALRGKLLWQVPVLFLLGGAQGALGWIMVKSGLVSDPRVSPYRLAAHLILAFALYGWLLWLALDRLRPQDGWLPKSAAEVMLRHQLHGLSALILLTVLSGAFVAGLDAGLTYNTFPLMDGRFVPTGYGMLSPWWHNLFENIPAVQFNHRWLAVTTALLTIAFCLRAQQANLPRDARRSVNGLLAMALIQPTLGITTLLLVVPVWLGALHQAGAVALFTFALATMHIVRRPRLAAAAKA